MSAIETGPTEDSIHAADREHRDRGARSWRFQAGLLIAVIVFGGLALLARATPYWAFDLALAKRIQSIDLPGFGTALGAISWIGFPPQFAILCALVVVALFLIHRARDASMLMLASVGAGVLWFVSTRLIGRPRPDAELIRVSGEVGGGSFPSGHVLTIVAIFGFIIYLAYTRLMPSWRRTLTVLVFGLPIAVVGLARVYAGHHWPSDVLGGYMLGSIWLATMIHIDRRRAHADAQSGNANQPDHVAVTALSSPALKAAPPLSGAQTGHGHSRPR